MVEALHAHDLVRVDPVIASRWPDADAWVARSLTRSPWAVVRRAGAHSAVPIGVRGTRRSERFAASVAFADICESISPFDLALGTVPSDRLGRVFARLIEFAFAWRLRIGPIGSYGFELASGVRATHETSDLDVLVAATHLPLQTLHAFGSEIDVLARQSGVRIDAELAYPAGGVALAEVLDGRDFVLFKTDRGPKLLSCPA